MFLPVVTPDVAGYVVWRWLYDQSFGALNAAPEAARAAALRRPRLTATAMLAVLVAELWHHAGFYVVIFLANLAICDRRWTEAAEIEVPALAAVLARGAAAASARRSRSTWSMR